jgi:hypothetical protein
MWYLIWALTLVLGILFIVQNAARMERKSDKSLKVVPPKDHK